MWQKIIVFVIVVLCLFFVGRRFLRQLKGRSQSGGCGCSCSGCDLTDKPENCCPGEQRPPEP